MKYRFIDHTADIAIKFFGKTIEELFINSALSLSEIIFNRKHDKAIEKSEKIFLRFSAEELTVLYIDFLREILYQINQNFRYFYKFEIRKLSTNELRVECYYSSLNIDDIALEIKAVTYHNVEIKKEKDEYSALVTFDI
jgi:SHS2 domain-containing protein